MTASRQNAILVLGMHRSGTSALARVLNLLGAALPDQMLPANAFNPTGYWEPTAVVSLNDEWLGAIEAAWDAPFVDDARGRLPADAVSKGAEVIREAYPDRRAPIVLKDPRCTLFVETWRDSLIRAEYRPSQVLIHRDVSAVAHSLARRDGFRPDEAGLLWSWYGVKALQAIARHGGKVIDYEALMTDWRRTLAPVLEHVGLDALERLTEQADAVDAFLSPAGPRNPVVFSETVANIVEAVEAAYQTTLAGQEADGLEALEKRVLRQAGVMRLAVVRLHGLHQARLEEFEAERDAERAASEAARRALEKERDEERIASEAVRRSLETERDAARKAHTYAQGERDEARRAFGEANDRADQWRSQSETLQRHAEALEAETERWRADFIALEHAVAGYREHSESLSLELHRTQADYAAADAERLALRMERDQASAKLSQIEHSTTWRASAPLRTLLSRAPWLTTSVRRVLKAGWWTVTGQLSTRLKARRHALASAAQDPDGRRQAPEPMRARPPMQSLKSVLDAEFGDGVADRIEAIIAYYGLAFQAEGQPPIKAQTDAETAAGWARRLAALATEHGITNLEAPDITIVIPAYNQIAYSLACLESVLTTPAGSSFEVLIGDDQSTDGTQAAAQVDIPGVRWIRHETNQGFVGNCNLTAAQARGQIIVFLNNDTIILPGWLDSLVGPLVADPMIGLTGSKLIYPDGRLQEAGGIFWRDGSAWNYGRFDDPRRPEYSYARDVDYISGASIAVPRALWLDLEGFDDLYRPAYAEDADLAFRVRAAGRRTVFQPRSMLLHFEGVTSGTDLGSGAKAYQVTNLERLRERWADVLADHRPNAERPDLEKERAVERRALFVDVTTPEPRHDAGSVVAVETMRALQALGYKVTFVPQDNFLWTREFSAPLQAMGVEVIYHPYYSRFPQFIEARGSEFDLVLIHRFAAAERILSDVRAHAPQAKVAFMPADLHFLREERAASVSGGATPSIVADTRRRELAVIRAMDAVLPHSTLELDLLAAEAPRVPGFHLPLIHDPEPTPAEFDVRTGVGFIGGYGHPPNVDAVDWFLAEIWPRVRAAQPDAQFTLAGSKMPDRFKALDGQDGVHVLGFVEELDEFFNAIRVSVAPLRFGAGAKGKVAASLAMGVPCVATTMGEEGMGLQAGIDLKVADDPDAFAQAILTLMSDEAAWRRFRQAGLEFAERETARAVVRQRVQAMIDQLGVGGRAPMNTRGHALSAE